MNTSFYSADPGRLRVTVVVIIFDLKFILKLVFVFLRSLFLCKFRIRNSGFRIPDSEFRYSRFSNLPVDAKTAS